MERENIFTTREAAKKAGISVGYLYFLMHKRMVSKPSYQFGQALLWTVDNVERLRKELAARSQAEQVGA